MTASKLICPECETVLRPAKALAPGKKVKCPECGNVFVVRADEEEERPARKTAPGKKASPEGKSSSKKKDAASKPAAKAPAVQEPAKKKNDDDDDGGAYGYIKEEEATEAEEEKKKISYAPDVSIKDLRGPAVEKIMSPSNQLALAGFACGLGWVLFLVLLLIPALFPIKGDGKAVQVMRIEPGLSAVNPYSVNEKHDGILNRPPMGMSSQYGAPRPQTKKEKEDESSFFEVGGVDTSMLGDFAWYLFLVSLIPLFLLLGLSFLVVYGAIQMQNLESRTWGMVGCIVAMLPLTCGGLQLVTAMVFQYLLSMVLDEKWFIGLVLVIMVTVEWLGCVASGVWALMTLMDPDVIAGFEYEPE